MSDIYLKLVGQLDHFGLDVEVQIPAQGVTALFGASGSGKTSLLRALCGFEKRLNGEVRVVGETWQKDGFFLPPEKRGVGLVFQEPSLFPHLGVRQNLFFGYERTPVRQRRVRPDEVIERLGLELLLQRRVEKLSGGEKQRVALGRALLASPKLLLLDEPLASLDAASRREILPYLKGVQAALAIPFLYVTHSDVEARLLAREAVCLEAGRVVFEGAIEHWVARLGGEEAALIF
jgi:molybdate transport system ATP-binding protein